MNLPKINIAIDGYSSCGKSTLAKAIAQRFKLRYVDTGAMYRAVALYFLRKGWKAGEVLSSDTVKYWLNEIKIDFEFDEKTQKTTTYLNGENVEEIIRSMEISEVVSKISRIPEVRAKLVQLQKNIIQQGNVVMDGRDIGTVVMPDADLKFYVTASLEVRAQRRFKELKTKGMEVSLDEVIRNLNDRDFQDTHRAQNPLKKAEDAIEIDTTHLSIEEQNRQVFALVEKCISKKLASQRG